MTPAEWAREAMESAVRCGGMERAITEIITRALAEQAQATGCVIPKAAA